MVVICRPRPALAEPRLVWVILIDDENCATTRLTLDLGKYIYRQISVYSGLIILVISCSLGQKVYIILYPKKERCGKQARILKRCRKEKIHFFLSRSKKYGVGWVKERRARSKVEGKRRREKERKKPVSHKTGKIAFLTKMGIDSIFGNIDKITRLGKQNRPKMGGSSQSTGSFKKAACFKKKSSFQH